MIYYTVSKEGEGLVREKMSRFLSFAIPIGSVEEAAAKIKEYQNKYHDSRHVCWAYMVGPERNIWQLNDNGEPSGTAGKPILGQINSKGITDVVVIVVRYFGGIKLGTSGLISAYKEAARLAIEDAGIKECHEMNAVRLEFAYEDMDGVMRVIKNLGIEILDREFDNLCSMIIRFKKDDQAKITGLLADKGARF